LLRLEIEPKVEKAKERQARNYNKRRKVVSYKPGDLVYMREQHLSNAAEKFSGKLGDRWRGPYIVLSVHDGVTLVVGDRQDNTKTQAVHVCNVRPCVERREDLQQAEAAVESDDSDQGSDEPKHRYNLRPRAH
jgi:hypothetical protein